MEQRLIYVRMKRKVTFPVHTHVQVSDIAHLSGVDTDLVENVSTTLIYHITKSDRQYAVIDSIQLIALLNKRFSHVEWEVIGFTETVLHIEQPKRTGIPFKLLVAWLILFVGTAMTIMNFHYDVSMPEVHQQLHYLFTGNKVAHPLWLQIPYSFGLGIGMILFLNHWFKKRFNEEPSPLEIELFTYEQQMEQYIAYYENDMNDENSSL